MRDPRHTYRTRKETYCQRLRNAWHHNTPYPRAEIAVGGPYGQRINPHLITAGKQLLMREGSLATTSRHNVPWYYLPDADSDFVEQRFVAQEETHRQTMHPKFTKRLGQTLEIAVQRAVSASTQMEYFGRFHELDEHDDATLYRKEEPPSHVGNRSLPGKQKLDFLVNVNQAALGWAGIEVKNTRPWIYPRDPEMFALLQKCISLNVVPVLIARRIAYVTKHLFRPCGVITWETLRQRYPSVDVELASRARHKRLLGYADIALGNEADPPLLKFGSQTLQAIIPEARERFDANKDLLTPYAFGDITYEEFAARLRRRIEGLNEDFDPPIEDWLDPPW